MTISNWQGVDVSHHQGVINWDEVNKDFAIIRAGYSVSGIDAMFEKNYLGAKKAGIPVRAYWYSYATNATQALQEAKSFEKKLTGKQIDLPVFLDIEQEESKENASEIVETFCSYMESKGYYAGVYSYKSFFNVYLKNITARYTGWVAQWADACTFTQPYLVWQKSDKGRVPGISGYVDLDEANSETMLNVITTIHAKGLNGWDKPNESVDTHILQLYLDGVEIFKKTV